MVIVTYVFRGKALSPRKLLFPISSKGSFICTFPQTGQYIWPPFDGPDLYTQLNISLSAVTAVRSSLLIWLAGLCTEQVQ